MKRIYVLLLILLGGASFAQDAARNWTVQLSATVSEDPAAITLEWLPNYAVGDTYYIWKKEKGTIGWGSTIATVSSGEPLMYTDDDVQVGTSYEYMIQLGSGGIIIAWSYINSGIQVPLNPNKGDFLILLDETFADVLAPEIAILETDLYTEGWMPKTITIDPTSTPMEVKAEILSQYAELPNLIGLYLLGDIPVPYSGDLYPDYYYSHKGAWPSDVYYADMFGEWTDTDVTVTVATDPRNHNIPGDGKFDQSKVPSTINLQVSRVDFSNLSVFAETEEELLRNYLNKAHEFKTAAYIPTDRGLIDQSSLSYSLEGFAQNGYRNFTAFFGSDNVEELDYWTVLNESDYLWSYGCGDGTYSLANGLNGPSALTSTHMAAGFSQSTFNMLYGSFFGDWDTPNNLMRSSLANGKSLSCSWAGRPNWHYHHMAMGENIGYSAQVSQDVFSDYFSLTLGDGTFITFEGVHVAQLGDPSLRMYYVAAPSDVLVERDVEIANLSWSASIDPDIDGYNVYRRTESGLWSKVNSDIITETSFTDMTVPGAGDYIYLVKAAKLKTNASGSFYNESLGVVGEISFFVGIEESAPISFTLYPNPNNGQFTIKANQSIQSITVHSVDGQIIYQANPNKGMIDISLTDIASGVYHLELSTDNQRKIERFVVQ
ncbi:T9SS type A sorting domain-containing protein [Crocinitomix sp.]|nr:T9SS type A sorting domain-containing protein [Crocinitomix sp.]